MNRTNVLIALLTLVATMACRPGTPSEYIQPGRMEDILVDYYMARAMSQQQNVDHGYQQALMEEAVYRKHGVTKAEFDSSLAYYYKRADRFNAVLQSVADRLEERALVLGATEGEIGKYAALKADGDTANIWADRSTMALMPVPPFNRWEFMLEADSTYRRGDSFMLQFMTNYMYQSGAKTAVAYMAVDYQDTTIARNLRFTSSGFSQLRFPEQAGKEIRRIRGYFYVDDGREESTTTRLLFLSNVQLIRFHNEKYEEMPKDSLPPDSVARPLGADSLGRRDSIGGGDALLSVERGTTLHRMVARDTVAELR